MPWFRDVNSDRKVFKEGSRQKFDYEIKIANTLKTP